MLNTVSLAIMSFKLRYSNSSFTLLRLELAAYMAYGSLAGHPAVFLSTPFAKVVNPPPPAPPPFFNDL